MNNKGQAILAEYVMILFVVIAALVAMSTFVQRGFEARIHDAKNFMINAVTNSSVCDADCLAATGGNIAYEYEPYYSVQLSGVQSNSEERAGATSGNALAFGAKYYNSISEDTRTNTAGCQLPAECADPAHSSAAECQCPGA